MAAQKKQAGSKEQRLAVEYVILRSGKGFTDGLCSGYLMYYHEVAGKQLSDTEVYRTLIDAVCMPGYTAEFNPQYPTDWLDALVDNITLSALPDPSRLPSTT